MSRVTQQSPNSNTQVEEEVGFPPAHQLSHLHISPITTQVKLPQAFPTRLPPPPSRRANTGSADHKWERPSTVTASSVLVKGHFVGWDHWEGAGLAQSDSKRR